MLRQLPVQQEVGRLAVGGRSRPRVGPNQPPVRTMVRRCPAPLSTTLDYSITNRTIVSKTDCQAAVLPGPDGSPQAPWTTGDDSIDDAPVDGLCWFPCGVGGADGGGDGARESCGAAGV